MENKNINDGSDNNDINDNYICRIGCKNSVMDKVIIFFFFLRNKVVIIMMVNEVFDVQWCYEHGDVNDEGGGRARNGSADNAMAPVV